MAQTVIQIPDTPPSHLTRSLTEVAAPNYSARLYVASYDSSLTTFTLSKSDSAISLVARPANNECGPDPTWLDLDSQRRKLFCLNEQIDAKSGNASFVEYDIIEDGNIKPVKKVNTPVGGPVQSKWLPLGSSGEGIHVIAHYSPGTFTALNQDLKTISNIDLAIGPPGPTQRQQEGKSNGHGVVTHPKLGNKILVPDLSQDKVWVIDCSLTGCKIVSSLAVPPGTGPRHGAIWTGIESSDSLYFYVVGEISNMIEGYRITTKEDNLQLDHISSTSATQTTNKEGYAAAEILVSVSILLLRISSANETEPDQKHLVVSNRANNLTSIEECDIDLKNCTRRPSDTMTTFKLLKDGNLENAQSWPAGGSSPRAFDFNKKGDLVAIGLDRRLVIMQRDVETGKIGQVVVDVVMGDQVTSVVWDETTPGSPEQNKEFLELN